MCHQSELETHPSESYAPNEASVTIPDWAPSRTLLIGFPSRPDTWRHGGIPAQNAILTFVAQLLRDTNETIVIISSPDLSVQSRELLNQFKSDHHTARLSVITLPMDDCWLRDTGPIFTTSFNGVSKHTGTCFKFNAWGGLHGGCYSDYRNDARLSKRLCNIFDIPINPVDIILEGGSVSSDGQGTILTTEECLLHRNRNPNLNKPKIEAVLRRYLGARQVIWLPYGAAYDGDTDGHVDNIAVFARPGHVILAHGGCEEHRRRSRAAAQVLERAYDANGNQLVLHKVPIPILYRTNEEANGLVPIPGVKKRPFGRICASYVNFLICGDCVFVPRFGVEEDSQAEKVLRYIFKGRNIITVESREFVLAGGGLHCLTLSVPR